MSIRRLGQVGVSALLLAGTACGSSSKKQEAPAVTSPTPPPPVVRIRGNWTYYDVGQGLSQDVQDVSADEGGNVYVAGGDAVYVKKKGDDQFLRFDAKNAGLTETCNDLAYIDPANIQYPPTPPYLCRVISVAGAAPNGRGRSRRAAPTSSRSTRTREPSRGRVTSGSPRRPGSSAMRTVRSARRRGAAIRMTLGGITGAHSSAGSSGLS